MQSCRPFVNASDNSPYVDSESAGVSILAKGWCTGQWVSSMAKKKSSKTDVKKINHFVQSLCGLYSRIARKLGVDRSYVSRVAKGERQSEAVEQALPAEFDRLPENE